MQRESIHSHVTYIDMSPPPECIERHDYSADARVLALASAMEARTARRCAVSINQARSAGTECTRT